MHDDDKRGPGLRFPPPLLMVVAVGGGYLADWIKPLPVTIENSLWLTGIALIVLSVTLALLAMFHFLESGGKFIKPSITHICTTRSNSCIC